MRHLTTSVLSVILLTLALNSQVVLASEPDSTTIVGGNTASPGAWPWQARIEFVGCNPYNCLGAGVLIDPQWVLTAGSVVGGLDSTIAPSTDWHK